MVHLLEERVLKNFWEILKAMMAINKYYRRDALRLLVYPVFP